MYHRKFRHMKLESGESDLDSYPATVRTCWSVKAYSGEPLALVVTQNKQESDIDHKRNGEGELSGAAAVGGLLFEDPNIPTVEQNIEVDSVDETPGWLMVYCMRIYDCINWCDRNITFSKTEK